MSRAIEYVKPIEGTDVVPFLINAYLQLSRSGHIDCFAIPASGAEQAFFIRNRRKKIVALLSFFKSDSSFTVNMGYVLPAYRNQGLYKQLWARLVDEAKTQCVKKIVGYHYLDNKGILAFNKKVGRSVKYVCSEYKV